MLRRVLLPLLIALLALGELATAAYGAADIREDRRRAAAAEKERRAVVAYRATVQPLVIKVFDAVQPMHDIDNAFSRDTPGLYTARDDVLARSGVLATLTAVSATLGKTAVPRSLTTQAEELPKQLAELITAARTLSDATKAKGDRAGYVAAYSTGYQLLSSAEAGWFSALEGVYGKDLKLPTPADDRGNDQGRRAPTRGGYIQAADLICAASYEETDKDEELNGLDDLVRVLPKEAASIRKATRKLMALRPPAGDAAMHRRLSTQLQAALVIPSVFDAWVSAARRSDLAAYQAATKRFNAALPRAQDVSRAYAAYGVRGCSEYWNVDDLLAPQGSGSGTLPT